MGALQGAREVDLVGLFEDTNYCAIHAESPSCPKTPSQLTGYRGQELKRRQCLWCSVVNSVKSFGLTCNLFYKKLFII